MRQPFHSFDVNFLLSEWDLLYQHLVAEKKQYQEDTQEISALQLQSHRHFFCAKLSAALKAEIYTPSLAYERYAWIDGKRRLLVNLTWQDRLLQQIFTHIINLKLAQILSPCCFSYQKNKSGVEALQKAAAYIRGKKDRNKKLDLYVLKTDLSSYTETIAVAPDAPLWPMLEALFVGEEGCFELTPYLWDLLKKLIRPEMMSEERFLFQRRTGILMGAPLCQPLANLYLNALDHTLAAIPQAFYARYGDDILFMHPDPHVLLEADKTIQEALDRLGLIRQKKKENYLYLTRAARPPLEGLEFFRGASYFNHVGYRLSADGTLSMKKDKMRPFYRMFREIIQTSVRLMEGKTLAERASSLCAILNQQFEFSAIRNYPRLLKMLYICTDRLFLCELDYQLALLVAEALTSCRGKAAFEKISYSRLRRRFGLFSFCQIKNKGKYRV